MERESRKPLSNNTKPILTKSVPFFLFRSDSNGICKGSQNIFTFRKDELHARTYAYALTPAHKYGTVAPANSCHVVRCNDLYLNHCMSLHATLSGFASAEGPLLDTVLCV